MHEKTFANFTLGKKLGSGGNGTVYQATDKFSREVALKILHNRSHDALQRFSREMEIYTQLDHEHIVKIYDGQQENDKHYISMQYISGGSLDEYIKKHSNKDKDYVRAVAKIFQKSAYALHYAHDNNIVHRDIKPANILLDKKLNPYITDFGLGKVLSNEDKTELTKAGAALGTLYYMSPEHIDGDPAAIDRQSDVYSLGATLYHALTGQPPFPEGDAIAMLFMIAEKDPTPPQEINPDLPNALNTICLRALCKGKKQRIKNCQEFGDLLGKYLAGETLKLSAPKPSLKSQVKKHWKLLAGSSVALFGAGLFLYTQYHSTLELESAISKRQQTIAKQKELEQQLQDENKHITRLYQLRQIEYTLNQKRIKTPEFLDTIQENLKSISSTPQSVDYVTFLQAQVLFYQSKNSKTYTEQTTMLNNALASFESLAPKNAHFAQTVYVLASQTHLSDLSLKKHYTGFLAQHDSRLTPLLSLYDFSSNTTQKAKQLLNTFPKYLPVLEITGIYYMNINNHKQAQECFEQLLATSPHYQPAQYFLAKSYIQSSSRDYKTTNVSDRLFKSEKYIQSLFQTQGNEYEKLMLQYQLANVATRIYPGQSLLIHGKSIRYFASAQLEHISKADKETIYKYQLDTLKKLKNRNDYKLFYKRIYNEHKQDPFSKNFILYAKQHRKSLKK